MGSFGERLRRERELRNITLDEIALSTKIGKRMLSALEAEEFYKLPGGIFNRGFVRAYANYLGMDVEQAVTDFQTAEKQTEKSKTAIEASLPLFDQREEIVAIMQANSPQSKPSLPTYSPPSNGIQPEPSMRDSGSMILQWAVVTVVLLGIGGFAWKHFSAEPETQTAEPPEVAAISPAQGAPEPTHDSREQANPSQLRPELVRPASVSAASPAQLEGPAVMKANLVAQTNAAQPREASAKSDPTEVVHNSNSGGDQPASEAGKFSLQIKANEESWVEITADGRTLMSGLMSPSSSRSFRANSEMVVKVGNASGVELSHNGRTLPLFPADARVKTLTFTPEGLVSR